MCVCLPTFSKIFYSYFSYTETHGLYGQVLASATTTTTNCMCPMSKFEPVGFSTSWQEAMRPQMSVVFVHSFSGNMKPKHQMIERELNAPWSLKCIHVLPPRGIFCLVISKSHTSYRTTWVTCLALGGDERVVFIIICYYFVAGVDYALLLCCTCTRKHIYKQTHTPAALHLQ